MSLNARILLSFAVMVILVAAGRTLTQAIEEFFGQLRHSTREAGEMIRDIDEATGEEAQGIHQISQSVSLIDQVAGETVNNAQRAAQASEALTSRAANLAEAVEALGRIIGRPAGRRSRHGTRSFNIGRTLFIPKGGSGGRTSRSRPWVWEGTANFSSFSKEAH